MKCFVAFCCLKMLRMRLCMRSTPQARPNETTSLTQDREFNLPVINLSFICSTSQRPACRCQANRAKLYVLKLQKQAGIRKSMRLEKQPDQSVVMAQTNIHPASFLQANWLWPYGSCLHWDQSLVMAQIVFILPHFYRPTGCGPAALVCAGIRVW